MVLRKYIGKPRTNYCFANLDADVDFSKNLVLHLFFEKGTTLIYENKIFSIKQLLL